MALWKRLAIQAVSVTAWSAGGGTRAVVGGALSLLSVAVISPAQGAGVMPGGLPFEAKVTEGSPISLPDNTWTWVDFPDAKCANGSATGIGVNIKQGSDKLVIFFEGGGACSDYASCYVLGTASNITSGYVKRDFDTGKPYSNVPLFSRTDTRNPYLNASYVYVPYCTGDVHSGSNVASLSNGVTAKDTYFVGYDNLNAYLGRLVPTFKSSVKRVLVSGWSAGGFGAAFGWNQIQTAFNAAAPIRVDALDDSGPPFLPNGGKWETWKDVWGVPIPADCPECADDPQNFIDYYSSKYDGKARFGLLSYTNDSVISSYYSMTKRQFKQELYSMASESLAPTTSFRYFFIDGTSHVMLSWDRVGYNGAKLSDWINQMYNDDPNWKSIAPPQ